MELIKAQNVAAFAAVTYNLNLLSLIKNLASDMSVCNTPKRGLGSKIVEVLRRWGRSCTQKFGFGELRKLVPSVISTRRPRVTFHCLEFVLSLMCLKIVLICIRRSRTQSFSYACANIVTAVLTAGQAPHAFAYARAFFFDILLLMPWFSSYKCPIPQIL